MKITTSEEIENKSKTPPVTAQGAIRVQPASPPPPEQSPPKTSAFSPRSVLLGLFAGLFIAGFSYYNDYGIKQNLFVGNHLPLTVYAGLFLTLVLVNPILKKFSSSTFFAVLVGAAAWGLVAEFSLLIQSWIPALAFGALFAVVLATAAIFRANPLRPFSRGELVVTMSMALAACSLPTSGLMRNFPQMLVMPQHYGKSMPDWEKAEPDRYVSDVNPNVFPQHDEDGKVYDGYVQGLNTGKDLPPLQKTKLGQWLSQGVRLIWHHLRDLPLGAWLGPVKVWFPILIVSFIFIISICRMVHRQWSEHEQLSYPIAEFAHSLMKNERGRSMSDVFYNRQFWIAFGVVFFIHIVNGWSLYDPRLIKVPMSFNLGSIWWSKFTFFHHAAGNTYLFYYGKIYLTVVAFAYFLPEEISLSLGLSLPIFMVLTAVFYQFGRPINGQEQTFMSFGSYVAMAGVIFYTGRYYYMAIFKRAFFLPAESDADDAAVAACRWFIASTGGFIGLLMVLGLDWLLATMIVFIIGVLFLVLARASAETGIPFMGTPFFARAIVTAALGPAAIGPASMYLLELITVASMQDARECLSPYVINSFRLGSRNNVGSAPMSRSMMLVLVPGLFVAGIAMLWVVYGRGAVNDEHMGTHVPSAFAGEISREIQKLKRSNMLETSVTVTGLSRLSSDVRDTSPSLITFFAFGIGLVLVNAMLRLRYVWWPLHPVAFLCWNVWATNNFVWSFMLGWLIKVLVVKIGGGRTYQNLKPLFIGVIIGDLCGGMFWIAFGPLWYFWSGEAPRFYGVFPF